MYRFTCLARVAPARDYSLARVAPAKKSFPSQGGLIANCVQVHVGEKGFDGTWQSNAPCLWQCVCTYGLRLVSDPVVLVAAIVVVVVVEVHRHGDSETMRYRDTHTQRHTDTVGKLLGHMSSQLSSG